MLVPAIHIWHALTISISLLTWQGQTPEIGKLLPYATYQVGRIFKHGFQVGNLPVFKH